MVPWGPPPSRPGLGGPLLAGPALLGEAHDERVAGPFLGTGLSDGRGIHEPLIQFQPGERIVCSRPWPGAFVPSSHDPNRIVRSHPSLGHRCPDAGAAVRRCGGAAG